MSAKYVIGDESRASEDDRLSSVRGSYNTIRPNPRRTWSYPTRITLAFALTAVMTAVVLVIVLAFVWEGQFMKYTRQNLQTIAQSTANQLAEDYVAAGGWTPDVVAGASATSSISPDVAVQLVDADGEILYDDTWSTARRRGKAPFADPNSPTSLMPTSAESIVTAKVTDDEGNVVGEVRLWAFGSNALLTKSDAAFRTNSYGAIMAAAAIAIVLAWIIGFFVSRALTRPINRITSTAAQIRNGDLTARTGLAGTDEIGQLGETFDDMATTLEKDIKLEHRLTSDVAHELRTPLMAIQATVEAMQDEVLPADFEHLETVASETRRLSRLVDAMLRLSRIENGTTELKIERTDLVYLVRSLVDSQHALFHERGIHLRFIDDTLRGELLCDVDPDLFREAIVNLLSNALRYTNEGGWVAVNVRHEHSEAFVSVKDTGIGIAKEDIPRTFSRFWRSASSRDRASGGLGVGLSITKEIVDRHNGTISVESELGKGTTFTISIPTRRRKNPQQEQQ